MVAFKPEAIPVAPVSPKGDFASLLAALTPAAMRERLAEMRAQSSDLECLFYILGPEHFLEWAHTIGVGQDDLLRATTAPHFFDEFDYVLLTYDATSDSFRADDEGRHQNRFGVPREHQSNLTSQRPNGRRVTA